MTKREAERLTRQSDTLRALGFTPDEADSLRRISRTLTRWFELECGDSNDYGSWAIERDDNGDGAPFMVHHHYWHGRGPDTTTRTPIADRENGARRRLSAIITARNTRCAYPEGSDQPTLAVSTYIQTDPRGCALYIIRPGDVPEGQHVESYYTRGIAIY